jgi:predicted Fe-S protein YdhL (DUF1289 family)
MSGRKTHKMSAWVAYSQKQKNHSLSGFLPTEVVRTVERNNSLTSPIRIKIKPD